MKSFFKLSSGILFINAYIPPLSPNITVLDKLKIFLSNLPLKIAIYIILLYFLFKFYVISFKSYYLPLFKFEEIY